jgi:hypothetical protein
MSRVIVLELNELTPALMDRFISQGHLPGFERMRSESVACITDAEERAPALNPWVQWVTVHTGLSLQEHGVFLLNDGPKFRAPRIWDIVADAGKRAWICGSMNSAMNTSHPENLFILPDPWAVGVRPHPPNMFDAFYDLVSRYVQEYTRDKPPLSKVAYLRFMRFMVENGLSPKTVMETMRQLYGERLSKTKWKRAAILDSLQWDVFRHNYRKLKPTLSTYFINSTAHYQHFYWRNMQPELFEIRDHSSRDEGTENAILFGYQKMDRIVQDAMALAGNDATLVLCTALGAQPMLKYDADGGRQIIRAKDMDAFLAFAGVAKNYSYAPVMSEQFHLIFANEADAIAAQERLVALKTDDGRDVMMARRDGNDLLCGVIVLTMPAQDTKVVTPFSNEPRLFHDIFYPAQGLKSGMHHPDGILWIRLPERRHQKVERKVSLREIAPTLLELSGVKTNQAFSMRPMPEVFQPAVVTRDLEMA